jgi:hypothetical protein
MSVAGVAEGISMFGVAVADARPHAEVNVRQVSRMSRRVVLGIG